MLVTMNDLELQRFSIIQGVLNNKLQRRDATSYRHLSRMLKAFKELGVESLIHGNRGKPSSNRISDDAKLHVLKLISEYYLDLAQRSYMKNLHRFTDLISPWKRFANG